MDPLIYSPENPGGLLIEELLEQVIKEIQAKQAKEPCRETALVLTNLEQALMWQLRRGQNRGTVTVDIKDPRLVTGGPDAAAP